MKSRSKGQNEARARTNQENKATKEENEASDRTNQLEKACITKVAGVRKVIFTGKEPREE